MESPRTATPTDAYAAQIIAQSAAVRASACETNDSRREHFVWPTNGRPAFYWYAVEAVAFDDYCDLPPAIVEAEGFASTESRAHTAALRAFDEDTRTRVTLTLTRSAQPRHTRRTSRAMRALSALVLASALVSVGGTALFVLGSRVHDATEQAVGGAAFVGGFFVGGLLHAWLQDHR